MAIAKRLTLACLSLLVIAASNSDTGAQSAKKPMQGVAKKAHASKSPRPPVAIVINPSGRPFDAMGRPLDKKLPHWAGNLTNAVEAHNSVGQSVVIYYHAGDRDLAAQVDMLVQQSKKSKAEVTAVSFDSGAAASSLVESWIDFHCTPDLTNRPMTPFAYLIVIGHGEMAAEKDRCLRCAEDLFNVSQVERKCSKAHFPLISVLHLCAVHSDEDAGKEVPGIEVPTVPIGVAADADDIAEFAVRGSKSGGALPTAWAKNNDKEDIVCRIASAYPGTMAPDDGLFFEAYRSAFELNNKNQFVQNLKGGTGENQNLRLMHLVKRMSVAATKPSKVGMKVEQRQYDICSNPSAITPFHIIASTNPEYVFLAPAISIIENFDPARDIAPALFDGISFISDRDVRRVVIKGNGKDLKRPYAAVNCQQLLSGNIPLSGKVLCVEMVSAAEMKLSFQRNDPNNPNQVQFLNMVDLAQVGRGVLKSCDLKGGFPKRYRISPPIGFFVPDDANHGLSLSPVNANFGPNDKGWGPNDSLTLGPMLLADFYDLKGETIDNWKNWEEAQLSIPLNERWIPQRWWRSNDKALLEYTPGDSRVKKPIKFSANGDAIIGVGGPVAYQPDIVVDGAAPGRKHGLDVELSFEREISAGKTVASVLLFDNDRVVGNVQFANAADKGKIRGFVPLPPKQVVNYLAVVLHGQGTVEIRDLQLGWTSVAK
ncbi:hypothetical protein [Anatilimnocola floriformis]|uniref:hypothetical protein n=1 Tax=Anatilimnocola floriformis TaxID=2948575 RepID=UPI0020C2C9C8|nr:hypothetical protein [Anatilimnocola floriformis]